MRISFVLIMILALATSAQAALTLGLSATQVLVGDTVTATVSSDKSGLEGFWGVYDFVLSEEIYYWSDPVAAAYDGSWSYHTDAGPGSVGDLGYAYRGYPSYPAVYRLNAAGSTVLPEAGVQFSINIKGVQPGTIYISLQDPFVLGEMSTNGPLTLVVIPEPMTISFLALGGLMFCRRGKK